MKQFYIKFIFLALAFSNLEAQVFWGEDFNDAGASTRWSTENAPGSKTNPTPMGITGLNYITNQSCNNYWIINDVNTPENNPAGVLPNGSTASYTSRFVRGRNYNCSAPNDLPNPDPGGSVTNRSLHVTFQGCSDSYWFGLNNGPEDYADEYSILNIDGPGSSGASSSDQYAYLTQDISTVGKCNIYLEGQFFLGGDQAQAHSYGTILYSINSGTTWKVLADNIGPTAWFLAGTCNNWEMRRWLLPAECEGITTLRLAFRWRNDGDAINTTGDYTLMAGFNVDNIVLKEIGPRVDFDFGGVGNFILTTVSVCKLEQVTTIRNNTTGAGITGYQWNIPGATYVNGTSSTDFEPQFMFDNSQAFGTKTVTLTVFYGSGCQASFSRNITLQQCLPVVDFMANYTTVCATSPTPVGGANTVTTFTNQTVSVPSRAPVSYLWSFSGPGTVTYQGGTNATSANPQVSFSAVGLYTVTLTATNADGSANVTKMNYINAANCECGEASAGTIILASYDWSTDNNLLGWSVSQDQGSGVCGLVGFSNQWRVDDGESARPPGTCGTGGAGDRSLYFGYAAGAGAAFCAGGQNETDIIQSPLINTVGASNLVLQFDFIGRGGGTCCRADFQYSTDGGSTWTTPASPNFTSATPAVPMGSSLTTIRSQICGSGQGQWTRVTWNMPAACANIPNLRIRFRFIITGSTGAVDPSFAVDKLMIYYTPPPTPPSVWLGNTADWHTASNWSTGAVPTSTTSISIPDVATLGPGKFMPVISSANAVALNVCNSGTLTLQNDRTLTIGGFLNNYGAITTTTSNSAADIIFAGDACVYRGDGLNVDVDYQTGSSASHALNLEASLSCRSFNLNNGTLTMGNNTLTLKKDFTRAAGTTLNTTSNSTFVFDGPMAATWVNPYNYGTPTVTTQDVTTNQNITIGLATTFPRMVIRKQNNANVATLASAQNYTISQELRIESGTLDAGTRTLNGAGNVIMTGGQLRLAKLNVVLPEITGTYTLTGGAIDFYGAGNQIARQLPAGSSTPYYDMIFQSSGTKTFQTGTTTCNHLVTIQGTATVDVQTNTFNGNADLVMAASACTLRVAKTAGNPTLPELLGTYTLSSPSVVELYTSAAGTPIQYLRNRTYARVHFANPTANCIVTRYLEGNTSVNGEVRITNTGGTYPTTVNIVDAQTYTFNGTANLIMANASGLRLAKNGVVLPEFTGTYTYTDGPNIENSPAVELYGDGSQTLRLQPPANPYRNLIFSNIGTKTLQSGITTATRRVLITNGLVIVPDGTDQFNGGAELRMTGGELQIATLNTTASLVPEFTGGYVLAGGRISFNGLGNQTIRSLASTPSIQYYELNFAGSGIKDYPSGNVSANSRLLLNLPNSLGNYVLGYTNVMIVVNPALGAINRTGGHIVGHLQRVINNTAIGSNYFFPVGSDNSNNTYYEPIFLKMNSALTGTSALMARFYNSGVSTLWTPPLVESGYNYTHLEMEGYWEMIPNPIPTGSIDYGIQVIPSSYWTYTGSQKALAKRSPSLPSPNDEWNWHGSTRIADFERTGYNSFSEFAIVTADVPLPVETTPLVAYPIKSQKAIQVQWNSLVEKDLALYELEKSQNPSFNNVQKIQTFNPKGNNASYEWLDTQVEWNTKYYYRYKALDFNGNYRYSNVAEAILLPDGTPMMVQFYPNPMTDFATLSIATGDEGNIEVLVYDAIGKLVKSEREYMKGQWKMELSKEEYSSGVYTYRVLFKDQQVTGKFIVK